MKLQIKTLGLLAVVSFGALNHAQAQLDVNDSNSPYTIASGTNTFDDGSGYGLWVGFFGGGGPSTFDVTGGTTSFVGTSYLGFYTSAVNTVNISAGEVDFSEGSDAAIAGTTLILGNEKDLTFNLSGGLVTVSSENQISRDGSTAILTITGGVYDVEGAAGTVYDSNTAISGNAAGTATINLGGNGVFEETGSSVLLGLNGSSFAINFQSGGSGELSLLSETALGYDALITAGDFQVDGKVDMDVADYAYSTAISGTQGVLGLATAPEPSTWAMLIGGFALLLGVQRLSRQRSV
jgi:hypothetical protein